MKGLQMKSANRMIVAMLLVTALAAAFWILLLGPKREEAAKLATEVEEVQTSLAQHQAEVVEAEEARDEFPAEYQRLVVLGKAVPGDDDTPSLLVQVNRTAERAGVRFETLELSGDGGGNASSPPSGSSSGGTPVSATEAAASLTPLGASIGPAGLGVMPYSLTFTGSFFKVADFIKGLDSLVETNNEEVRVNGRLLTIDGFSLTAASNGFPALTASFAVTTYLTPPSEGIAGGASPSSPESATATPAATTLGGTP